MWLERWLIIVPVITHPRLAPVTTYLPTGTEIALTAASAALLALLTMCFFKLFPIISVWEVAEGRVIDAAHQQVVIPPPEPVPSKRLRRWGIKR
jgi:molybdopterin-containing oxidoreductase family membrane subunit